MAQGPRPEPRRTGTSAGLLELIRQLVADAAALVQSHLDLARAEIGAGARVAGGGIALVAIGLFALCLAIAALAAALVMALVPAIGPVLACLVAALLIAAGGGALVMFGLSRIKRSSLAPRQAIANVGQSAVMLMRKSRRTPAATGGNSKGE
ncbi:phage holin family protein [Sandarakinorhabdus sp.]|uniref:phage holin family protein n=1 Tax=Sandarakinorhabdus sp. TaxID=1916663 RepID=UPI00286DCE5B|nr:phage holin family protein [Sandarakinorhabdus sp.]